MRVNSTMKHNSGLASFFGGTFEDQIVRFRFVPSKETSCVGGDIFVKMLMPVDEDARKKYMNEIEDAISSYIDIADPLEFDALAIDVAKSFDDDAEIVAIPTFQI